MVKKNEKLRRRWYISLQVRMRTIVVLNAVDRVII